MGEYLAWEVGNILKGHSAYGDFSACHFEKASKETTSIRHSYGVRNTTEESTTLKNSATLKDTSASPQYDDSGKDPF